MRLSLPMNKLHKYLVWGILTLCYYLVYSNKLNHVIAYHEQHHLFLFTEAYFKEEVASAGILSYLTDFLIQFFYYPALGYTLLALLIASVYLLTQSIISKLFGKEDFLLLSVIPSLILFFHTIDATNNLIPIMATVLSLSGANLLLMIFRHNLPLFPIFKHWQIQNQKWRISIMGIALIVYATFAVHQFSEKYNKDEALLLKAEMYAKQQKWQQVLKYTQEYLNGQKTTPAISQFHHLALYHTGQLPQKLFDFPQPLGMNSLFIPWSTNPTETEYGHYIYKDLGLINEAHRWEFEAMVAWGETASHLQNLARYNIIMQRPKVAQRFINQLKESLFYKESALRLEKQLQSGNVEGFRNALVEVPDSLIWFTNPKNLGSELKKLCDHDPKNKMAFEYYMCTLLLGNYVATFVENLPRIKNFDYSSIPSIFEEALLVHKLQVGEEEFAKTGFSISPITEARFDRYYELTVQNQMAQLHREFGKTFWYYLNHTTPYKKKK